MKKDILKFAQELNKRRSVKAAEITHFKIEARGVLSESCLGLCVK